MGTHGQTGLNRYVAGSVTEYVVRRADVPVLTARATDRSKTVDYDEVLVPTDGSDPATAAVDPAIEVAAAADARIHAVNVVDVGGLAARPRLEPPVELVSRHESVSEEATEDIRPECAKRDSRPSPPSSTGCRHGPP